MGGDGYVVLTWEAPADDGGSQIVGYKIYCGMRSGGETYLTTTGNVTTYRDTGVTNGRTYYYRVSAVNGIGEGELSEEVSATPLGAPSAPRNLVARGGDGYVVLTWEAPADDGGSPIIGYKIYRGTSSGNETYLTMVGGNETTYNDTGLTNGQTYYYRVSAVNGVGEGELSEEVNATPQSAPPAPADTSTSGGMSILPLLAAIAVAIVVIVLIVLFSRWRKSHTPRGRGSLEGESWGMSIEE
ncbi:MAG: fibronectin type III domain-containing protein [Thermoplasmata archaeon]|nr:fibronectin type III domain-containing protein [Thermoplasmata archaeon]